MLTIFGMQTERKYALGCLSDQNINRYLHKCDHAIIATKQLIFSYTSMTLSFNNDHGKISHKNASLC